MMIAEGTISPEDLRYVKLTDDPDEAVQHLATYIKDYYQVKERKGLWLLGESRKKVLLRRGSKTA
jgi:predicted Rossmann-fold nucleotide-binding protein